MTEFEKRAANRQEKLKSAINDFLSLNEKSFSLDGKINFKRHECIVAVFKEIADFFGEQICIPPDWDKELLSLAENSKIACREVVLHEKWYREDAGVIVAFLRENNFPVGLFPDKNGYKMFEPQTLTWKRVTANEAKLFSVKAFCFYKLLADKEIEPKDLVDFTCRHFCKSDIVLLIITLVMTSMISLFFPLVIGIVLDKIVGVSQYNSIFTATAFLFVFLPSQFIFKIIQILVQIRIETKTFSSLQNALWHRILHYKTTFFRKFSIGDLADRLNNVGKILKVLQNNLLMAMFSLFTVVINLGLMFFYNPKSVPVILLLVATWLVAVIVLNRIRQDLQNEINEENGKMSGFLLQMIKGISKIQTSSSECTLFSKWTNLFVPRLKKERKQYLLESKIYCSYLLMQCFAVSFVYFLITKKVVNLSAGNFAAFTTALSVFLVSMWDVVLRMTQCSLAMVQYKRVVPILSETSQSYGVCSSPGILSGSIDVQNVTFRYSQGLAAVLKNISLSIKPGEFVAFVGASGCGKSTLMKLLLGFETPESGCIRFDGQDLASLDCKKVRRQFGVVLQNGKLLSGDIYTNIAAAVADLPMKKAWKAAEAAGIAEDIREMPMGMFTQVSDGAANLSGGQRQRILIARAIARNPRILLFDEATSALDNKTQKAVSESIEKLKITRVVIAHRLSTIKNADRIFVFADGKIEQVGTYDELMATEGTFYKLAKKQMI
jgi:ATP-binding cassette subfamily C protein